LLAVSKTKPAQPCAKPMPPACATLARTTCRKPDKQLELADLPLIWHFIGPIQSNKTRAIAEHFDWVHSVDRLKIAQRLSEQRLPTCRR
jgi:uncharacterized pyridoxal phosphate-containing UPF0001 family protein